MKEIVHKLKMNNETIATMESCTGGGIANAITNVVGASDVILYSAVTYSNEYKIKMGVNCKTIDKYSVYSLEVVKEMSLAISSFCNATYGIGVTGKINNEDSRNLNGDINTVFISIYNSKTDEFYTYKIAVGGTDRKQNKDYIIDFIKEKLKIVIK